MNSFLTKHFSINQLINKSNLFKANLNCNRKPLGLSVCKNRKLSNSINNNAFKVEQITIPVPWGDIKGQLFGERKETNKAIICLHGYLDNSNSFRPIAPYICKNDDYYMISIDLPGHGFSCKLPDGIPYSPKLIVSTLRRIVRKLGLKDFYFVCHSYGIGLGLLYHIVFKNEVKGLVSLDWIFPITDHDFASYSELWKNGIDNFIDFEEAEISKENHKKTLTRDLALSILMRHNNHLNEESAKILLERALIANKDGSLQFSRDIRIKHAGYSLDHYIQFYYLLPEIMRNVNAPILSIHADPPSFGEDAVNSTIQFLKKINQNSKNRIEFTKILGTHHFHMIKPKETSEIIHKFFNKIK